MRMPPGLRASSPLGLPTAAVGVAFGVFAAPVVGATAAVAMSALVWSGTAQFATLSVLSTGGGAALATAAGLLANARYLPMGFAIAPSMRGTLLRRVGTSALLADASFVIAHRRGSGFDIPALRWAAPVQYVAWVTGTAVGALGAGAIGNPDRWGVGVLFPVFYFALLLPDLRRPGGGLRRLSLAVAACGAALALALTPVAPPGVPVLAATAAAVLVLPTHRAGGEES